MNLTVPETLSLTREHTVLRHDTLLIYVSNQPDLFAAYGEECVRHAVCNALLRRLNLLDIETSRISFVISAAGEHIAVALPESSTVEFCGNDLFLERIRAALAYLPVQCGTHRAFISVLATIGIGSRFCERLLAVSRDGILPWNDAEAASESMSEKSIRYRADMALAAQFFADLDAGRIVLAFQAVVTMDHVQHGDLYHEGLLRRLPAGQGSDESCAADIQALEHLGLIDRLDRSVLWAIIDLLEFDASLRLGCNVSAISLRHDGWWRLLQDYLINRPDVAARLTLEITETSAISQSDEARNLLLSLRLMGCRIALDDMGAGYSTVSFLEKMRPDFVKIDRAYVTQSSDGVQSSPDLLRHLIALCAGLSSCVIAEGIESEAELQAARQAGAGGAQGYFIERPSILPEWLSKTVVVHDSFAPDHRCLALPLRGVKQEERQ